MKTRVTLILVLFFATACEDVVDVAVPSEPPRLSVDALIRINGDAPTTLARVKVGLTSSFFEELPATDVDAIQITNTEMPNTMDNPNFIELVETEPGIYEFEKNTGFFTEGNLELAITHNGQNYLASTHFVPSVAIDTLIQGTGTLFTGEETEIIVAFTDDASRDDFYVFDFDFDEYLVTEDEFYQGQTFLFSYFYQDGLSTNQELTISLLGINEAFFNYMNQLIVQAGGDQGPFQTPAATVRGNITNVTALDNTNNFALGYFAVVEEFTKTITIQ